MATLAFKPRPLQVQLNITNRCNLRCRHCFISAGPRRGDELTTEEVLHLVDELGRLHVPLLKISGGEPCLAPNLLQVVERAHSLRVVVSLLTNGTLVTQDTADRLSSAGLTAVGVSIDGTPATHDYIRRSTGSFAKAVRAIECFKRSGIAVQITMTLTNLNYLEIPFVIDLSKQLGTKLNLQEIVLVGRATENQELLKLPKDLRDRLNVDVSPYLVLEPAAQPDVLPLHKCDAGRDKCIISPTGEVSPCSYVTVSAGNIRDRGLEEIWLHSNVLRLFRDSAPLEEPCRSCAVFEQCGGGCRARAWLECGRLTAPDPACRPRELALEGSARA